MVPYRCYVLGMAAVTIPPLIRAALILDSCLRNDGPVGKMLDGKD